MKFNLNNYPKKLVQLGLRERKNDSIKNKQKLNKLLLPEIITELNNNNLLNIESKEEISIIFEDFTWFGKIKNQLNNCI